MTVSKKFADRSFFRKIGLYFVLIITVGAVGGVLIYVSLMQFNGWSLNKSNPFSSMFNASVRVVIYLYESPSTAKYFASVGGRYDLLTRPWRDYADSQKFDFVVVSALSEVVPEKNNVLVLPSAVALSEDERRDVIRYKAAGGSVLLTWATGARDGSGKWVGWDFLRQIAGVEVDADLPETAATHQILTKGESPLTYNMAPASRIDLGNTAERPIFFRGGGIAALAGDDSVAWNSAQSPRSVLAFNEFSNQNLSRVVAFGVPETAWEYNRDQMHQLLNGTFSWLTRQPVIIKGHWPRGASSAYMIAVNSPDTLVTAQAVSNVFQSNRYMGTFFIPSSIIASQNDALGAIEGASEIAYLGDSNLGFKGQTEAVQSQRIRQMISSMPPAFYKARTGFQAPNFSFDSVTEQLLYENNIDYHLSKRQEYRPRQPYFGAVKNERVGERFVILPLQDKDIFETIPSANLGDTDFLKYALNHFDNTVAQGAFGCLLIKPRRYDINQHFESQLNSIISHAKSGKGVTWFSNGHDISKWWNDRDRFQLRVRHSNVRIAFDISNVGDAAIANASIIVMLPDKSQIPSIRALKAGQPEPQIERLDEYRAAIIFNSLPVGDFSYQIAFQ
jgi:hypothetical protein